MAKWLFDSVGSPIAFIANEHYVFHISGECIGKIIDGNVWNKQYVGEIRGDRLFYKEKAVNFVPVITLPVSRPGLPTPPMAKSKVLIPPGYRDVYLDEI
jgi:hypothetical protein